MKQRQPDLAFIYLIVAYTEPQFYLYINMFRELGTLVHVQGYRYLLEFYFIPRNSINMVSSQGWTMQLQSRNSVIIADFRF